MSSETALVAQLHIMEKELADARAQLAAQEELLRSTGDKLVQDAEQVVNVLAELEERDRMIAADLQHALRFQRAILPPKPSFPQVDVEVIYLPAEIVSGDLYDVAALDEDVVRVLVADATGHGIAAALTTMFVKSQYDLVKRAHRSPAALLAALNDAMASYIANVDMRFTAICADYHPRRNEVVYSTAAHEGPLAVEEGKARWLEGGGSFLGLAPNAEYPEQTTPLAKGDGLYLLTDGLADTVAKDGSSFGEDRIVELALAAHRTKQDLAMHLMPALSRFVGEDRALSDDVTVVGLRPR